MFYRLQTLDVFLREAGLPEDTGNRVNSLTLEKLISEKRLYDLTISFEKVDIQKSKQWTEPGKYLAFLTRMILTEL
jgi:hypothetical protein